MCDTCNDPTLFDEAASDLRKSARRITAGSVLLTVAIVGTLATGFLLPFSLWYFFPLYLTLAAASPAREGFRLARKHRRAARAAAGTAAEIAKLRDGLKAAADAAAKPEAEDVTA